MVLAAPEGVYALPPDLTPPSADMVSGIACPQCHGVLRVRAEGAGHLNFTCRVGHALSLKELVAALERLFEDSVWAAIRSAEEIDALLGDVLAFRARVADPPPEATYEDRRRRARQQALALRELIDGDEPITFREGESA
jgi:two-component system, chemotaxis family, protein-glutamate methylesterase/glutaminase